jgi:hypothetical protein
MATVAVGIATFAAGGSEAVSFTWTNALTGSPVTYAVTPTIIFGPCQTVLGGEGPGVPFLNGAGAITTTGGTVTMANPPDCFVSVTAIGT